MAARRAVSALRSIEAGKIDLQRARVLLEKARPELEPRQWELLNEKLLAAKWAREHYESLRPKEAKSRESESPAIRVRHTRTAPQTRAIPSAPRLDCRAVSARSSVRSPSRRAA
ncbi:MAG TPA: hypothetical protein VIG99_15850, partial [Myxococcaceae bacterium]